jgi:hypothetical protein
MCVAAVPLIPTVSNHHIYRHQGAENGTSIRAYCPTGRIPGLPEHPQPIDHEVVEDERQIPGEFGGWVLEIPDGIDIGETFILDRVIRGGDHHRRNESCVKSLRMAL